MAYEMKPGQGSAFPNDKKKEEKHPDFKGKIKTPDGKDWEISMWNKSGSKGNFYSISIQEPYNHPQQSTTPEPDEKPF